ncbi:hypothetical protein DFH09DRAFT_935643, partial [Mycena vulgaris]
IDPASIKTTSVHSERTFSVGRRKLGFMQHNTSDQNFRNSMAASSLDGAPFFPNLEAAIKILQQAMERGGGSAVED